jgi:hypothetical protein
MRAGGFALVDNAQIVASVFLASYAMSSSKTSPLKLSVIGTSLQRLSFSGYTSLFPMPSARTLTARDRLSGGMITSSISRPTIGAHDHAFASHRQAAFVRTAIRVLR